MKKAVIIVFIVMISLVFMFSRLGSVDKTLFTFVITDFFTLSDVDVLLLGSSSIAYFNQHSIFSCDSTVNRGIGNSHISDVYNYVKSLKSNVTVRNVIIYAGENDLYRNASVQDSFLEYQNIVTTILSKAPSTKIHILGVKYSPARSDSWSKFSEFNHKLEQLAGQNAQVLFYMPPRIELQEKIFSNDGIHLNQLGETMLFGKIGRLCE